MSYIVILMSFTAIFPSIGYGLTDTSLELTSLFSKRISLVPMLMKYLYQNTYIKYRCVFDIGGLVVGITEVSAKQIFNCIVY
jgi:IMP cyclohydrolase